MEAICSSETPVLTRDKWYKVSEYIFHLYISDIEAVTDIIAKFAKSHEKRLQDHINIEASRLLNVNNITRRNRLN
jgi:hypothetical protein